MIKIQWVLLVSAFNIIQAGVIVNSSAIPTRRILQGHEVGGTRPYMVYLRPAPNAEPHLGNSWLCGGVIIDERFVLTSAACIEDVKNFYVVSGTNKWVPPSDNENECVKNGAKKAIWKCVPMTYTFDGGEFDNIRWMSNDIAVVKVEDKFNFERRVKGCDFVPKKIAFNNRSNDLEKSGTVGSIAGWGSTDSYGSDFALRATSNSPKLLETDITIISKKNCKKRWDPRYHQIIDDGMICAKDGLDSDTMSLACAEHEVKCKELVYSEEQDEQDTRRMMMDPDKLQVHSAMHNETRRSKVTSGGFCENDHGGPLVVGQGATAVVVGVISACQTRDVSKKCYGPFLYSSVYKNRHLLSCAIDKEIGVFCRKLLRSMKTQISTTTFDWNNPERPPETVKVKSKPVVPGVLRAVMVTTERFAFTT